MDDIDSGIYKSKEMEKLYRWRAGNE